MKKFIAGFLSIVLLLCICTFHVSAQTETVDEENFETASEKVVINNHTFSYAARPKDGEAVNAQADYGVLMSDKTQSSKVKINFNELYTGNFIYEMDFRLENRLSQAANAVKLVRFYRENTETSLITLTDSKEDGYKIRVCGKDENGNYTYVSGGDNTGKLKYKTWYHLRVKIDVVKDVYSVYVNDYPVAENQKPYRNSFSNGIDNVIINTDSALDSAFLIDNISVKRALYIESNVYKIYKNCIFGDFEDTQTDEFLYNLQLPMHSIVKLYSDYTAKTVRTGNVEDGDVLELVSKKDASVKIIYTLNQFSNSNVYYVSSSGNDFNDGLTPNTAFASLNQAKNAVNIAKAKQPNRAYYVKILPGEYQMDEPVVFTKTDGGSAEYPIIYERYGEGEVIFKGSKVIEKAEPVQDSKILDAVLSDDAKSKLLQIDLKAEGIKIPQMPDNYGFGAGGGYYPLRVYINGQALTEARFPNAGDVQIPVKTVNNAKTFTTDGGYDIEYYDNDAPLWRTKLWNTTDRDIFIAGTIAHEYAYNHLRVKKFDPRNKNIVTQGRGSYAPPIGKSYFWFTNILEEIDVPGESYLDEENGILYFYPYEDMVNAKIEVCTFDKEMLQLNDADYITFKNLNFEYSNKKFLLAENSDYLTIDGCIMAHTGETAVQISGNHTLIQNCHIYDLAGARGLGGIHLTDSGDRESLTSGASKITNNKIHDTDVIYNVSQSPAIYILNSVGTEISNNEIYNGTAYMVRVTDCNDIVFKRNEIYNAVTMSSDAGAVTWGRDITLLGFKVIENYFHDIGNNIGIREQDSTGQECKRIGQQALFHDDGSSGPYAYGNIFYQAKTNDTRNTYTSVKANGGQYGIWENNIFIGGESAAYFSSWSTGQNYNGNNVQDIWWLRNYNVYELESDKDGSGGTAIYWDRISNPELNFFENEVWKAKYSDQYGAYWTLFTPEKKQALEAAYDSTVSNIKNNQALLDAAAAKRALLLNTNIMKNNVLIDTLTPLEYKNTANYHEAEGSVTAKYTTEQAQNWFKAYGTDFDFTKNGLTEIQKTVPAFAAIDFDAIGYKAPEKQNDFEISDVTLENQNLSLTLKNCSEQAQDCNLVLAAYSGDRLVEIKAVYNSMRSKEAKPIYVTFKAAVNDVKVFVLKDFINKQLSKLSLKVSALQP